MATYSRDLEKQMQQYIDAEETARLEFRKLLQSTTAEIRYKLLMEVRGVKYGITTGVYNAAYIRDLSGAKCMLDGMSEEQKFNTLKITDSNGFTPLHTAVDEHRDHPYSSEVAKELTNNLSTQQLYQLLKMKTKESESTVLHIAVYRNRIDFVTRILAQLTLDQKNKLLSIRNAAGATPADLSVPTIFSTVQVVAEQKNELAVQKNELAVQKNELAVQKNELAVHKNELAVQKNELAEQKNELAEQGKGLREAQQTIETVNGELVIQGTVQSQLSDRCKELEAERAQELKETKKALVDLQTTSDVEKEKLQKTILQMEQNVLKQTEVVAEQTRELNVQKNQLVEQDKAIKQTNKVLTNLQQSSNDQMKALENQNILQTEVIVGQKKEISQHGQTQQVLLDKCAELDRQKQEQGEVITEQTRELNEQKNKVMEQQNQLVEQGRALQDTRDELDRLQEKNGEQERVIQVMTARQAAMEQMLDRLELEFRRPIVTDETGDQENEDY